MKHFFMPALLVFLFFTSSLFATNSGYKTRFDRDQVVKDVNAQQMNKYENDNFQTISAKALVDKGIISDANLTIDNSDIPNVNVFFQKADCSKIINNSKWSATIYGIDAPNGTVTCMVAPVGDLNNPVGIFNIYFPKAKVFFNKDLEDANTTMASDIAAAKTQFDGIYGTIKTKQDQLKAKLEGNQNYLTVPEVFTSVVLTDTDTVDIAATRGTGKLQFNTNVNISNDAQKIAISDAESIFNVYAGLSDVSMQFYVILLSFFAVYGLGRNFLPKFTDKIEGKQNYDKHIPYLFGLIAGALLFIPTSSFNANPNQTSQNGKEMIQYDVMDTQWQHFERDGYSLFSDWANHAASVIIDAEMQSIINKSGIGTASQIINAYAGYKMYDKLYTMTQYVSSQCYAGYNISEMYMTNDATKFKYSDNSSIVFPTSENYGYAMALYNTNPNYYRDLPKSNFYTASVQNAFNNINTTSGESIGSYYYPKFSLASCGKNYFKMASYKKKKEDYFATLNQLRKTNSASDATKLNAIQSLVESQYDFYNNSGYLSVLELPVVEMQTEMIGGLYSNPESKLIQKLNETIEKKGDIGYGDNSWIHSFFSSIPYMFIPGAGTVFEITSANSGKIGGALGTVAAGTAGAVAGGGIFSAFTAAISSGVGAAIGTAVGTAAGGALGMNFAYHTAKTILDLSPIVGIMVIGILRFIIILIKIFMLHFAGLFLLPVAFAKENIQSITKFGMKVFATMLEIPLFVVSVWLAIKANNLIHSIGDFLGKKLIISMIDNNNAMRNTVQTSAFGTGNTQGVVSHWFGNISSVLKLYVFDGFIEVAVAVFSIVLIYKILITFHNTLLDAIEVQGSRGLDDAVESIRNEASGWGTRI